MEVWLAHSTGTWILTSNSQYHRLLVHLVVAFIYLETARIPDSDTKTLKLLWSLLQNVIMEEDCHGLKSQCNLFLNHL